LTWGSSNNWVFLGYSADFQVDIKIFPGDQKSNMHTNKRHTHSRLTVAVAIATGAPLLITDAEQTAHSRHIFPLTSVEARLHKALASQKYAAGGPDLELGSVSNEKSNSTQPAVQATVIPATVVCSGAVVVPVNGPSSDVETGIAGGNNSSDIIQQAPRGPGVTPRKGARVLTMTQDDIDAFNEETASKGWETYGFIGNFRRNWVVLFTAMFGYGVWVIVNALGPKPMETDLYGEEREAYGQMNWVQSMGPTV
jgi:hypothetical protein